MPERDVYRVVNLAPSVPQPSSAMLQWIAWIALAVLAVLAHFHETASDEEPVLQLSCEHENTKKIHPASPAPANVFDASRCPYPIR